MLLGGFLMKTNPDEGIIHLQNACGKNIGDTCHLLSAHYFQIGERDRYRFYLNKACELGIEEACARLNR